MKVGVCLLILAGMWRAGRSTVSACGVRSWKGLRTRRSCSSSCTAPKSSSRSSYLGRARVSSAQPHSLGGARALCRLLRDQRDRLSPREHTGPHGMEQRLEQGGGALRVIGRAMLEEGRVLLEGVVDPSCCSCVCIGLAASGREQFAAR